MIPYYKIIIPLIAIILIAVTVRLYIKGNSTLSELMLWCFIWVATCLLAIFPEEITSFLAEFLGIKGNVNAVLFAGQGFLFAIQYYLFLRLKKQNRVITDLVRKVALKLGEEEKKEE